MTAKKINSAFTLIELLIVIAILGTLAVVVLIALNPAQQLARTRDAGRISSTTQLGHAVEAYAISNSGTYLTENNTWMTTLVSAGEINVAPTAITYSISGITACATNGVQNGFCYDNVAGGVIVYARLESKSYISKCDAGEKAFSVYSTVDGQGGIVCTATEPAVAAGGQPFI